MSVFSDVRVGPRAEADIVRDEIVVSRLNWIIVQGWERRRVLMLSVIARKAMGEGEEGSARRSWEWRYEKVSIEVESSSGVSGSRRGLEWS